MTSDRQRAANARNAAKSTGPRTEAGKARSALNSIVHGGYATQTYAIPFGPHAEDPDEVAEFIDTIARELEPRDQIEVVAAEQIGLLMLQVQRLGIFEAEGISSVALTRDSTLTHFELGTEDRDTGLRARSAMSAIDNVLLKTTRVNRHLGTQLDRALGRYRTLQNRENDGTEVGILADLDPPPETMSTAGDNPQDDETNPIREDPAV